MKKLFLGILSIVLLTNIVLAEDLKPKSPAQNSMTEIDNVFIDSKNYKKQRWFKKTTKEKPTTVEKKEPTKKNTVEPIKTQKQENKQTNQPNQKINQSAKPVNTVKPKENKPIKVETPVPKKEVS